MNIFPRLAFIVFHGQIGRPDPVESRTNQVRNNLCALQCHGCQMLQLVPGSAALKPIRSPSAAIIWESEAPRNQFGYCEDQQRQTLLWSSRWLFINHGSRSSFDVVGCCMAPESLSRHNHPGRAHFSPSTTGPTCAPDLMLVTTSWSRGTISKRSSCMKELHPHLSIGCFCWLIFMTYGDADRSCSSPQPTIDQLPIYAGSFPSWHVVRAVATTALCARKLAVPNCRLRSEGVAPILLDKHEYVQMRNS